MNDCANDELPKEIGHLVHLTYLYLDNTSIRELPESIRNLRNLLYLKFDHVYGILPNDLNRVQNLQYLHGASEWMVKDLPSLSPTVIHLQINNIREVEEMEAIYGCLGILKESLLTFTCKINIEVFRENKVHVNLEKLAGFQRLWSLDLYSRLTVDCAIQFPPNLVSLTLQLSFISEDVDLMEVLGRLSKLKCLRLLSDSYLGTQLSCTGTAFPQL
ncbi:hypothetical protein V2J09_013626 [Rumex salicifolius]